MSNLKEVRNWLNSLPGMIEADNPNSCLRRAWGASGIQNISVEEFKETLQIYSFVVEQLGVKCILRLPSAPLSAPDNSAKLRNIAG